VHRSLNRVSGEVRRVVIKYDRLVKQYANTKSTARGPVSARTARHTMDDQDRLPISMAGILSTISTDGSKDEAILSYRGNSFHLKSSSTELTWKTDLKPLFQGRSPEVVINMSGPLDVASPSADSSLPSVKAPHRQFEVTFKKAGRGCCGVHGIEVEDSNQYEDMVEFQGFLVPDTGNVGSRTEAMLDCRFYVSARAATASKVSARNWELSRACKAIDPSSPASSWTKRSARGPTPNGPPSKASKESASSSVASSRKKPARSVPSKPPRKDLSTRNGNVYLSEEAGHLEQTLLTRDCIDDGRRGSARALAQTFVDALMHAPLLQIPGSDGMSYLSNIPNLETGDIDTTIVVRKMTCAFWTECRKLVDTPGRRYRVAAIGTPGIGKTTTTPLLIRDLLSTDNTVVYLVRTKEKTGWYYEFVSKDGEYTAEVYPEIHGWCGIESLKSRSTYYIVDPGSQDNPDSCDEDAIFQPKLIIVASPDERHWGSSFWKQRSTVMGGFRFIPIWSEDELIAVQPYIRPDMSKGTVMERYERFGGSPRHVFGPELGDNQILGMQDNAFGKLDSMQVKQIAAGGLSSSFFKEGSALGTLIGFDVDDDDKGNSASMWHASSPLPLSKDCMSNTERSFGTV
jgi:hypothetical protein